LYKVGKIVNAGGNGRTEESREEQEAFKLGCISHAILTMLDKNEF